jgi:hypothetical protein
MSTTSVLDDDTLAVIRLEAMASASPFINPKLLREAEQVMHLAPPDWLARVTGRPVHSWRYLTNLELTIAVRAIRADRAHLDALRDAEQAEWRRAADESRPEAAATAQAGRDAWEALRARLPVPVVVLHNWTSRHLDGYEQGADHIVVLEDLHADRFHRAARQCLCETPSRASQLRHVGSAADDETRIPDCRACLRHAERLAGRRAEPTDPATPARHTPSQAQGRPQADNSHRRPCRSSPAALRHQDELEAGM